MKDIRNKLSRRADKEAYQKVFEMMQYERLVKQLRKELKEAGRSNVQVSNMKKLLFDRNIVDRY